MQNKLLKIARMGLALAVLVFAGALPALAQDCHRWIDKEDFFWGNQTPEKMENCLNDREDVHARDESGQTPLHRVVQFNTKPEVIMMLVEAGANINSRDYIGFTPLHYAAKNAYLDVTATLLALGADINVRDARGRTPLYESALGNKKP